MTTPHSTPGTELVPVLDRPEHVAIQRIIVPIDETLFPERALSTVLTLARTLAAEVVLVCACEPFSGLPSGNRALPTAPRTLRTSHPTMTEAQERLTRLESAVRARGPEVSSRLRQCFPPAATVETAMENPSALILLCTSLEQDPAGHPALPDFAAEVLYHVDAPVLLVGPMASLPFELGHGLRIAISTRDLHASKTGFEYALLLAQVFSGEITTLTGGQRPEAARDGETVLGEVEWETMQNRCRQQHSGLRTAVLPDTLDVEETLRYLAEYADLLIVANPHEMAAQWRTAQAVARLLSAGTMPVLAVP